jgi:hypothetical protein
VLPTGAGKSAIYQPAARDSCGGRNAARRAAAGIGMPGSGQAFFRHASEPSTGDRIDGPTDFGRVQAVADEYGGVKLLGPPPFAGAGA